MYAMSLIASRLIHQTITCVKTMKNIVSFDDPKLLSPYKLQ